MDVSVENLTLHPACELLPQLGVTELDALAEDVRLEGQQDDVIVLVEDDGARRLLDGRNRFLACRRAGVEPRIREVTLAEIGDPVRFVLSRNVFRRHLTAGQRAMAFCMLTKNLSAREGARESGISRETLRRARVVLEKDANLARKILAGDAPLHNVFEGLAGERSGAQNSAATTESATAPKNPKPANAPATTKRPNKSKGEPRPPMPAEERTKKGAVEGDDPEFKKCVAACGMLASIRDPYTLVQKHGDPTSWRYFTKAKRTLLDLEDSV